MEIRYLGHSSFFIKTKSAKIVTDPFSDEIGLKFPKIEADIVTVSHDHIDHNQSGLVSGEKVVFDWPGEYERMGVRIIGFESFHDPNFGQDRGRNTMFKFETEGISLFHLGDLGEMLKEEKIEALGEIDVLMIPVGGVYTIEPKTAYQIVKNLESPYVLPMHFYNPELNQAIFGKLARVDEFLNYFNSEAIETVEKLVLRKEEIDKEKTKVIVFKN